MTDHPNDIDVTENGKIDWIDDQIVGLYECVCGKRGDFTVTSVRDDAIPCRVCGRRLYVRQVTQIFEVKDGHQD